MSDRELQKQAYRLAANAIPLGCALSHLAILLVVVVDRRYGPLGSAMIKNLCESTVIHNIYSQKANLDMGMAVI